MRKRDVIILIRKGLLSSMKKYLSAAVLIVLVAFLAIGANVSQTIEQKEVVEEDLGPKPTIYLASDSTVQTYADAFEPQTGWGECLADYFSDEVEESVCTSAKDAHYRVYDTEKVTVENHAIGGRSSRSYIEQGRLDEILNVIQPGDYLFLQWGHNDATESKPERYVPVDEFPTWLAQYVDGAREKGAIPVLITPVVRYSWSSDAYTGKFKTFNSSFEKYRKAMIAYAKEADVALIDLTGRSIDYANALGAEGAKSLFLMVEAGEYPKSKYRDGVDDHTHLQYAGAKAFAGCVADGIRAVGGDDETLLYENEVFHEDLRRLARKLK